MNFSNEHWKLVITPRYVRKDKSTIKVDCLHCNGKGQTDNPEHNGGLWYINALCIWCHGTGEREVLPQIPPPPDMDPKFLADLKDWFINYGKKPSGESTEQ